jgi:hypothetical protein
LLESSTAFYRSATEGLVRHDAKIDKLIGDEVMALFIPGICGPHYHRCAAEAALALMRAVGYAPSQEPWMPLGAVHAGLSFVGDVWRKRFGLYRPGRPRKHCSASGHECCGRRSAIERADLCCLCQATPGSRAAHSGITKQGNSSYWGKLSVIVNHGAFEPTKMCNIVGRMSGSLTNVPIAMWIYAPSRTTE